MNFSGSAVLGFWRYEGGAAGARTQYAKCCLNTHLLNTLRMAYLTSLASHDKQCLPILFSPRTNSGPLQPGARSSGHSKHHASCAHGCSTYSFTCSRGRAFTAVEAGRLRCTSAASFPLSWSRGRARTHGDGAWPLLCMPMRTHGGGAPSLRNGHGTCMPMALACRWHLNVDGTCMPMALATVLPRCAPSGRRARPASHQGGHRVRAHLGQLSSPMHLPN